MTAGILTMALCTGLVALAVFGPWLLRHAAPALVRVPRLAIVVVAGGIKGVREAILRTSALTDDLSPDHWTQHRLNLTE